MLGKGYKIEISRGALLDLEVATAFYQTISEGVEARFKQSVAFSIDSLPAFWAYEVKKEGLRKIKAGRFPYDIFFSVDEAKGSIIIEAVKHERVLNKPGKN